MIVYGMVGNVLLCEVCSFEMICEQLLQIDGDIVIYVVMLVLWCFGGFEIEFSFMIKVIVVGIWYFIVVWIGIGCDYYQILFGGIFLDVGFFYYICLGIGQVG